MRLGKIVGGDGFNGAAKPVGLNATCTGEMTARDDRDGNGDMRGDIRRALASTDRAPARHDIPQERATSLIGIAHVRPCGHAGCIRERYGWQKDDQAPEAICRCGLGYGVGGAGRRRRQNRRLIAALASATIGLSNKHDGELVKSAEQDINEVLRSLDRDL